MSNEQIREALRNGVVTDSIVDETATYSVAYMGEYGWSKAVFDSKDEAEAAFYALSQESSMVCVGLYDPAGLREWSIGDTVRKHA